MNKGRRIVFDDDGFIAEGGDVARDIASKSGDYSEEVELVNMPADLLKNFEAKRVSFDHTARSGYVTKIHEALNREFPAEHLDASSLFLAVAGVKGAIEPPGGATEQPQQDLPIGLYLRVRELRHRRKEPPHHPAR